MTSPSGEWLRDLRAALLPWGVYSLAFALGQPLPGAIGAAAALVALRLRRWREIKLPDVAILVFFLFVVIDECCLALAGRGALRAALLPSLLALVAVGSSLLGRPFTLQYARQAVGPEWWDDPNFLRVNQIITAAWGISFVTAAVLNFVTADAAWTQRAVSAAAGLALFVSALCFTRAFPRWYRLHRYLPRVRAGLEPYRRAPPRF